jgi:hypothetical protein
MQLLSSLHEHWRPTQRLTLHSSLLKHEFASCFCISYFLHSR